MPQRRTCVITVSAAAAAWALEPRRCRWGVVSDRSALSVLPSLPPARSISAALRFRRYSLQWQELQSLRGARGQGQEASAAGRRRTLERPPRGTDTSGAARPARNPHQLGLPGPWRHWRGRQDAPAAWAHAPYPQPPCSPPLPLRPLALRYPCDDPDEPWEGGACPRRGPQRPHLLPVSWHLRKLELFVLPHRAQPPGSNVLRLAEGLERWALGLPLLAILCWGPLGFAPSSCACPRSSQTTGISGLMSYDEVHVLQAATRCRAGHLSHAQRACRGGAPAS